MAPIIYVIRHAEGCHNVSRDFDMDDPDLTEQGVQQCEQLREFIDSNGYGSMATHLIASPSLRTIRTCELAFQGVINNDKKIILHPDFQETGGERCNIPHNKENIEKKYGNMVDTSLLDVDYTSRAPGTKYEAELKQVEYRVQEALQWLRKLAVARTGDAHIFVVTHQAFIRRLTGDNDKFNNAAMRSYQFRDLEAEDKKLALEPTPDVVEGETEET